MANPNNCETCEHRQRPDGGHCYMFADSPTEQCMIHTGYKEEEAKLLSSLATLSTLFNKGLLKDTAKAMGIKPK